MRRRLDDDSRAAYYTGRCMIAAAGVNSDISINEDETPVDCQTKATRRDYRLWPRLDEKRHSILDVPGRDYSCGGALAVLVLGRVLEGSHCLEVDSIMSLEVFS